MDYDMKFKTIYEFKRSVVYGAEVFFNYDGKSYGILRLDEADNKGKYVLCTVGHENDVFFDNFDSILDYEISGKKFRSIVHELEVTDRNL